MRKNIFYYSGKVRGLLTVTGRQVEVEDMIWLVAKLFAFGMAMAISFMVALIISGWVEVGQVTAFLHYV